MNGRVALAVVFVLGGAGVALAGAQPQAARNPAQAVEQGSGDVRVKGTVAEVDRDEGVFALEGGGDRLTVRSDAIPEAVRPGLNLLAEGRLVEGADGPVLSAERIQLGCPSTYDS